MWDMLTFFSVAILEAVQRGPDLSFSRWWCYKSQRSFPVYLASEVQMWSNAPIPNQKSVTKVSKSRTIPYVPGFNPPEWSLVSAHLTDHLACISFSPDKTSLKPENLASFMSCYHYCTSLQCRRFWWFSCVKPPFWIRRRDCGPNNRWEYPLVPPKSACTAGYCKLKSSNFESAEAMV